MAEPNPFEAPTTTASPVRRRGKSVSILLYAVIGGGIGLFIGVLGIVGLFVLIPGAPGVAELLILLVGIGLVFVLPGLGIGVLIAFLTNSGSTENA